MRRLAVSVMLISCGGSVASLDTVDGTVQGHGLHAVDASAFLGLVSEGGSTPPLAAIVISDQSGTCDIAASSSKKPNATYLILSVSPSDSGAAMVAPGTYAIGAGPNVGALFVAQDASCAKTVVTSAASGSITLSSVTSDGIAGSFDALFQGGDHLTGTFDAPSCSADLGSFYSVELSPVGACR